MTFDYAIIGAGLFGSTCAQLLTSQGKRVIIYEREAVPGGNLRCDTVEGIVVHLYGAHIFHTNNRTIWDYVNRFTEFVPFINSPIAYVDNIAYNMPFNMNTFAKVWRIRTPAEAAAMIRNQTEPYSNIDPKNLEEQALKNVGPVLYNMFIKGYTEKHWGRSATELPASIIRRIPIRLTYNNNYFVDRYQGVPLRGYNEMIKNLIGDTPVEYNTGRVLHKDLANMRANKIIYTGELDNLYLYHHGALQYRSIEFNHRVEDSSNYQGNAVINYCDAKHPLTRSVEHKHFLGIETSKTVITDELSREYDGTNIPMYPIVTEENKALHGRYLDLAKNDGLIVGGRLGDFRYYDMADVVMNAMNLCNRLLKTQH